MTVECGCSMIFIGISKPTAPGEGKLIVVYLNEAYVILTDKTRITVVSLDKYMNFNYEC